MTNSVTMEGGAEARAKAAPALLLVDDDEMFRYSTAKILGRAGFEVMTAPDYREALEVLESDRPVDLLILDLLMPNRVNGFALGRMARMRRLGLKLLYVTAFDVPTDEATGKVLRKPIEDERLIAEVKLALAA